MRSVQGMAGGERARQVHFRNGRKYVRILSVDSELIKVTEAFVHRTETGFIRCGRFPPKTFETARWKSRPNSDFFFSEKRTKTKLGLEYDAKKITSGNYRGETTIFRVFFDIFVWPEDGICRRN